MRNKNQVLSGLREKGHRITKIRRAILDLFFKNPKPVSALEIRNLLSRAKIEANKTTIYRELAFLKSEDLIRELQLGEDAKRYEIASDDHHHHLVCRDCDKIEDIVLERDLENVEKNIEKTTKFKIESHTLEFYGMCRTCQIL